MASYTPPLGAAGSTPIAPTSSAKSSGWYIFIGCSVGLILSNTKAAPIALGILGIALIYQLNNLLLGK